MTDNEKQVLQIIRDSVSEAVKARLAIGYGDAPLAKMVDSIVLSHAEELRALIDDSFSRALKADDFRAALQDAFNHKLARVLVSKFEGEIEKRTAAMRCDETMRARITLAIENAIKTQE